jgi:4-amino-4-deoxy-L-arabinose transferase-like glycosyltransferase
MTTLFYIVTARGYGIFRDELYYLACAEHLDWGYVDHPPLVALGAWLVRNVVGTSLLALRLPSALTAGALVLLGMLLARRLGGERKAQLMTGVAVALAPQYLGVLSIYSMNSFDLLVWSALFLVALQILATDDRRLWLLFGLLAGIGLQNKFSVLFLGFGLGVGLLMARRWRLLRDVNLWTGVLIAMLIFLPHVLWQMEHGWPTIEFIRNATQNKNIDYSPLDFLLEQVLIMNPAMAVVWVLGLAFLLGARRYRAFQAIGWAYLAIFFVMVGRGTKPYYLTPFYPVLFAAGAVVIERFAEVWRWRWLVTAVIVTNVVSGAIVAPLARPLLPVERYVRYAAALGFAPGSDERHQLGRLPQFFADMHGWKELTQAVAAVHHALPATDRDVACVFAQNYGQAGAIDFFGPDLGLPPAMAGHNSYWLWGPDDCSGEVIIVIGGERRDLEQAFDEVVEAGHFTCRDCMPYESDRMLYVGRGFRGSLEKAWQRVKHYD